MLLKYILNTNTYIIEKTNETDINFKVWNEKYKFINNINIYTGWFEKRPFSNLCLCSFKKQFRNNCKLRQW